MPPQRNVQAERLRAKLNEAAADPLKILPHGIAHDGLSARLCEQAGFEIAFMGGFAVSASHGLPDTGYLQCAEMCERIRQITDVCSLPLLADGDTGYGNAMNVRRTVHQYAKAGAAGIMLEDQEWPKRCGHMDGKRVIAREEAVARIRAAVEERNTGIDIFIQARTDARCVSFEEALLRAKLFKEAGADGIVVDALTSVEEMKILCQTIPGPICANNLEGGKTPILTQKELARIGFALVSYPLSLVTACIVGMQKALEEIREDVRDRKPLMSFRDVCNTVGFGEYVQTSEKYKTNA
ncbi:hypothetical protein CLAIMM_04673 [Cladophialophora immunda]|nr:hypothetical protein CLAIMM_04673 [Cladophialophora immunda]